MRDDGSLDPRGDAQPYQRWSEVRPFVQAVAYRLFSHKSYIVVPRSTSGDDMNRLTSLCSIHSVGLVTFALDRAQPDYAVVVLPVTAAPDMFYVNSCSTG